jgi:hypothetical protein
MERYDPGLKTVAAAQKARDAGDVKNAHALYIRGIEELLALLQKETNDDIRLLVRKHASKFMKEAEALLQLNSSVEPPKSSATLKCAQRLEKQANDLAKSLAFQRAHKAFIEAAEAYQVRELLSMPFTAYLVENKVFFCVFLWL